MPVHPMATMPKDEVNGSQKFTGLACPVCRSSGKSSFQGKDMMFGGTDIYEYMQCVQCGAVYQTPMPSMEEIAAFYPQGYSLHQAAERPKQASNARRSIFKYGYGYDHLQVPFVYQLLAPIFSRLKARGAIAYVRNGKLLDIGCGNGKFLLSMNRLGWRGTGLELSDSAVKVCREAGLNVIRGELFGAGFKDEEFDLVTARQLIEHLPEPRHFIREVARILKPGGRFVLETPNSRALARSWFGTYWYANEVPRHLVLFNALNLRKLIEGPHFTLLSTQLTTTPKMFLNSWDYLTNNKNRPSKKRKIRRLLVRPYVTLAQILGRGDFIFQVYEKR